MPNFCGVVGCGRRGNRDKNSFFRLPCIPKRGRGSDSILVNLKTKRRLKWILALRRADLTETKLKYIVVCDRHFISGRPASNYDIENPDWVPSINMGYLDKQKPTYTSPHIEYLRSSVINQNESNEDVDQSSLNTDIQENITNQDSNTFEVTENDSITLQTISAEENYVQKDINLPEENISTKEILPKFVTCNEDKNNTAMDKHFLSEFISNEEVHENMSSKIVQTDLTMTDLDNISDAFKDSVIEVNQLRAKLKALTEDILHINEMYC